MNSRPLRESDNRNLGDQEQLLLAKIDALERHIRNIEFALMKFAEENDKLREQLMRRYELK